MWYDLVQEWVAAGNTIQDNPPWRWIMPTTRGAWEAKNVNAFETQLTSQANALDLTFFYNLQQDYKHLFIWC